ncbi:MAG: hypothetical protein H6744_16265 [Deltaproteobacteria bacterium]|nr:hypothetical protein [Deltaproteobacteria bacterium]
MRALLVVTALVVASCADKITIVECPLGTEPQGSECIPLGLDLISPQHDVVEDSPGTDAPELPIQDITPAQDADAVGPKPDLPDTGPDAVLTGGVVGAACNKSSDCAGGVCLDWPGGYCTALDCTVSSCPSGSKCMPLAGGNAGCMATCTEDADCRGSDQTCKTLAAVDGSLRRVCHGVASDAHAVGETCIDAVGCAGAMTCLPSLPGGYCASLGCNATSCPTGSSCFNFGGFPTCLKTCGSDGDCGGEPGAERRCGILKALDKQKVGACISGAEGLKIGEQCSNDFECQSGACEVLGEGRCTQNDLPCFLDNEKDVCGAGFCFISGQNQVGACVQPCALGTPCPGLSFCAGTPGSSEGVCRPACDGLGASDNCRTDVGFECTYGWPLGSTAGQGRYLCHLAPPGSLGTECTPPGGCPMGQCLPITSAGGMCGATCGEDGYCPFPGSCVVDGQDLTCRKACFSAADCAEGATCGPAAGALGNVCR